MIVETNKQFRHLLIAGILFLTGYSLGNVLYKALPLSFILVGLLGITVLIVLIQSFLRRNRVAIFLGLSIIGIVVIIEIFKSELFKSKRVLEAHLSDDFLSVDLILRENNKFEIISHDFIGFDEVSAGEYEIKDKKIIFRNRSYGNNLIPDTVFIFDNKIFTKLNATGEPDFIYYFEITSDMLDTPR